MWPGRTNAPCKVAGKGDDNSLSVKLKFANGFVGLPMPVTETSPRLQAGEAGAV